MQIDFPKLDKRVVIKGYRTGIGIFFDEDSPFPDLLTDLASSLEKSNAFFIGAPVTLNIGRRELGSREFMALRDLLVERHRLMIAQVHADAPSTRTAAERLGLKVGWTPTGAGMARGGAAVAPEGVLAAGGRDLAGAPRAAEGRAAQAAAPGTVRDDVSRPEAVRDDTSRPEAGRAEPGRVPADRGAPPALEGPVADTLMVRQTLRSGQRVEFPGHVVVLGDVNSGAEIVAAGDIVVLGALRGLAHAGAPHDSGAVIVALGIQPPQLRIGTVISRGGTGPARREPRERETQPEIARVEGETIVVETFRGRL